MAIDTSDEVMQQHVADLRQMGGPYNELFASRLVQLIAQREMMAYELKGANRRPWARATRREQK